MDDFIDDSDAKIDISAEIRNIFGYDRRKFRDEVRVLKTLTESTARIYLSNVNQSSSTYFLIYHCRATLMIDLWKIIDTPM